MLLQTTVGQPQWGGGGAFPAVRSGKWADMIVSELQGRFFENNYNGNLFSAGMTLTSISNVTFTTGTLGATCTPIIGVWNPTGSGKNLSILQARVAGIQTAATCTGGGGFMWCWSLGNSAISTGITPFNRATLLAAQSVAKAFAGTALTGLTNNLVANEASGLQVGPASNFSLVGTAVGFAPSSVAGIENIDGAFIVPPGGVLALLATTTPVAISAVSSILWAESPL